MRFEFRWNPFADQPHNVASRKERLRCHLKHGGSYLSLVHSNLRRSIPFLTLYRRHWKRMYKGPIQIEKPFSLSVSPVEGQDERVLELFKETGIRQALVRIPSWEKEDLSRLERFSKLLYSQDIELTLALLQNRGDVLNPLRWRHFLEEVFSRFSQVCSFFEIGHAWNRTKWGVWDHREYLRLARPAVSLAKEYGVKIVGPAVIDFEFHLYPPILETVSFDRVSSLLYVDRMGAPEEKQCGWDTSRKLALLKAIVDSTTKREQKLWITEVNWPLKGTGKYSPASGKPNVTEEEQANYLVRYYVLCVASGFVERVYWWQLIAPGYGLVDSRKTDWRRRPSFDAMKTLVARVEDSTFLAKIPHPQLKIFSFCKGGKDFLICWSHGPAQMHSFSRDVLHVVNRDGKEISPHYGRIEIDESPKYVYLK